jgi:hypothetical protein
MRSRSPQALERWGQVLEERAVGPRYWAKVGTGWRVHAGTIDTREAIGGLTDRQRAQHAQHSTHLTAGRTLQPSRHWHWHCTALHCTGQARPSQVRPDWVRSDQVRSGHVISGQAQLIASPARLGPHMPDELLATMPPIMQLSMEEGSGPILYCTGSLFLRAWAASSRFTSPAMSPGSTVI